MPAPVKATLYPGWIPTHPWPQVWPSVFRRLGLPAGAGFQLTWVVGICWLLLSGCTLPNPTVFSGISSADPPPPPSNLQVQSPPGLGPHPTLADLWDERAIFVVDVTDTGLPMGESDTLVMANGEWWSYVHASDRSAGVVDRCGDPVPFPGCLVIYRSRDGGVTFRLDAPPTCQIECRQCPCNSIQDHIEQQQYPKLFFDGQTLYSVYEYKAMVMLRTSADGLNWNAPQHVPLTGIWEEWLRPCRPEERIGLHPFAAPFYDCLAGGPPGIFVEKGRLTIFLAQGRNPGSMGCITGPVNGLAFQLRPCRYNPLFTGSRIYGPLDDKGPATNDYFDFRTVSSAEVQKVGERYYMLYEGVRGAGRDDPGDTQFALGLARSVGNQIDGPWERFAHNPILVDQPGNIGLGHGDLVVFDHRTYLYTSLDGQVRSRLALVWQ